MEQLVGRFRCTDKVVRRTSDEASPEFKMERALLDVEDDEEEVGIIQRLAAQFEKLTKEQKAACIVLLQGDQDEPTPIEQYKAASDRRWGIKDRSLAGNVPASKLATMRPIDRFKAASDARWGIGQR